MFLATYLKAIRKTLICRAARAAELECTAWWRDPLAHPDIREMDQRMLADLPFPTLRRVSDRATC